MQQPTPPRHTIRLDNGWEPPAASDAGVRLERRFGRPSGLCSDDRVLLVLAGPTVAAAVIVNEAVLPPIAAGTDRWEHDITPLLRDRNELVVLITDHGGVDAALRAATAEDRARRGRLSTAAGAVAIEIVPAG